MSLKVLANKVLERNAERNADGTVLFHPPGKTTLENGGGGGTRFSCGDLGSKAVLIQTAAGVPEVWSQGVADLLVMNCPTSYEPERWNVLREDSCLFLRDWAAQARQLGWTGFDLFGVHQHRPQVRYDCIGLVPLLRGRAVAALSEDRAAIKTTESRTLTYRRKSGVRPNEACLLWAL